MTPMSAPRVGRSVAAVRTRATGGVKTGETVPSEVMSNQQSVFSTKLAMIPGARGHNFATNHGHGMSNCNYSGRDEE